MKSKLSNCPKRHMWIDVSHVVKLSCSLVLWCREQGKIYRGSSPNSCMIICLCASFRSRISVRKTQWGPAGLTEAASLWCFKHFGVQQRSYGRVKSTSQKEKLHSRFLSNVLNATFHDEKSHKVALKLLEECWTFNMVECSAILWLEQSHRDHVCSRTLWGLHTRTHTSPFYMNRRAEKAKVNHKKQNIFH